VARAFHFRLNQHEVMKMSGFLASGSEQSQSERF